MSCRAGKREDKGEPLRGGEPGAAVGAVEVPLEGLEGLDPPTLGEAKGKEGNIWVGEGVLRGRGGLPLEAATVRLVGRRAGGKSVGDGVGRLLEDWTVPEGRAPSSQPSPRSYY